MEDRLAMRGSVTALILIVLRDGTRHGYDITREVVRRSDGAVGLSYGTLYNYLKSMEADDLIAGTWEKPAGERERRLYQLTPKGEQEARKVIASWNDFTAAMNKIIERRDIREEPA